MRWFPNRRCTTISEREASCQLPVGSRALAVSCHADPLGVHASIDGRGTIEFAFAFEFSDLEAPPDPSFAVAGGTGELAGISGELLIDETDADATRAELDAVIPRR